MTIVISILTYRYSSGQIIAAAETGAKTLRVKGIAWGGGGAGINRIVLHRCLYRGSLSRCIIELLSRPISEV